MTGSDSDQTNENCWFYSCTDKDEVISIKNFLIFLALKKVWFSSSRTRMCVSSVVVILLFTKTNDCRHESKSQFNPSFCDCSVFAWCWWWLILDKTGETRQMRVGGRFTWIPAKHSSRTYEEKKLKWFEVKKYHKCCIILNFEYSKTLTFTNE